MQTESTRVLYGMLTNQQIIDIVDRHIYDPAEPNYLGLIEEMLERHVPRGQTEQILHDVRTGAI